MHLQTYESTIECSNISKRKNSKLSELETIKYLKNEKKITLTGLSQRIHKDINHCLNPINLHCKLKNTQILWYHIERAAAIQETMIYAPYLRLHKTIFENGADINRNIKLFSLPYINKISKEVRLRRRNIENRPKTETRRALKREIMYLEEQIKKYKSQNL